MKRSTLYLSVILGLGACSLAVYGGMIAQPPPGPARIAKADAVIVGKVEALEPQDVKVGDAMYRIAIVRINQGVKGIKDEKTLRIGFVPPPNANDKGPRIIRTGARPVQLAAGQEGLFILTRQGKENFYVIGGVIGYYINSENNKDFDKEVQVAKTAAKVMVDPQGSLKATDAEERLLAAAMMIEKHRTFQGPKSTQAPIDAEESKQLMQVLADADWKTAGNFSSLRPNPNQLFQRLGVTPKDGFVAAAGGNYQTAAQAWVRDNAQKYRIQRLCRR